MERRFLSEKLSVAKNSGDRPRGALDSRIINPFARILNTVVFWGLLCVIPLAVSPYGTVDTWWEATFECLIFFLTAAWIVAAVFAGDWQIRRLPIVLPMAAITVYAFVQAIR